MAHGKFLRSLKFYTNVSYMMKVNWPCLDQACNYISETKTATISHREENSEEMHDIVLSQVSCQLQYAPMHILQIEDYSCVVLE